MTDSKKKLTPEQERAAEMFPSSPNALTEKTSPAKTGTETNPELTWGDALGALATVLQNRPQSAALNVNPDIKGISRSVGSPYAGGAAASPAPMAAPPPSLGSLLLGRR